MTSPDIVVIGAGILGLSTARRLLQLEPQLRVVVVEKESAEAVHQTGHNSGVLHTGLYYRPGSEKAHSCTRGRQLLLDYCREQRIPVELCGKVVVATTEAELPRLAALQERAKANGVVAAPLTQQELRELEPHAFGLRALHVPGAGIIDYSRVCSSLRDDIQQRGGTLLFSAQLLHIARDGAGLKLRLADQRELATEHVVACAGLQSDRVSRLCRESDPEQQSRAAKDVQIIPFRGEYYELSGRSAELVRHLIYPVPDPSFPFLGVHFTRGIDGVVDCGPSAVLNLGRETYDKWDVDFRDLAETLAYPGFRRLAWRHAGAGLTELLRSLSRRAFHSRAKRLLPDLTLSDMQPAPAGIRAQAVSARGALVDDFIIEDFPGMTSVTNAPSPAATSSLAIGEKVAVRALAALQSSRTLS